MNPAMGAMITIGAGIWLTSEFIAYGGWWRCLIGALFIAVGMVRICYISTAKEEKKK